MINCSIHNYKEWIGAYIEGNLSNIDMRSAEIFLQQHPHILDSYLAELEEFTLVPEEIEWSGKENLHISILSTHNIHANNFTEYFISSHEGVLDISEQEELNSFLQINPKLKSEFQIYGLSKLSPDFSVQYPFKKDLLKKQRPAIPLFWPISAAASILLVLGIWFLWPSNTTNGLAFQPSNHFKTKSIEINTPINTTDNNSQLVNNSEPKESRSINKQKPKISPFIPLKSRSTESLIGFDEMQTTFIAEAIDINNQNSFALVFIPVPAGDKNIPFLDENITDAKPKKKGLLSKIFSDDPKYIEDYVNATFTAFNDNKEEEKWVLKVERDENGKSKKVKFTSPLFSSRQRN